MSRNTDPSNPTDETRISDTASAPEPQKDPSIESQKDPFELFLHSYRMQIRELQGNLEYIDADNVRAAVRLILDCKGKLVLTGIGKSGLIAHKLAATFSSTGTPAFFLHPGESLHGDLGVLQENDVLLVLAKSGESDEVISMLQVVRKMGNPIISILGNPDSTAGRMSDIIIRATVSREADSLNLAPTASTTVSLVVGDTLAAALSEIRDFRPENFAMYHPAGQLGRRLLLNVEDLLDEERGNPTIHKDATMTELLQEESRPNLGGIMILDDVGKLVGLITDGDIRRAILKYQNVLDCKIVDIMTTDPLRIVQGSRAIEALRLMQDRPSQISVMPVVNESDEPIGLLRLHDLIRAGL
ncbi:MAG: KpsF/GutQ family sugar-phosphate isomerase [bacterium]|nr:KpsF/GutQ family sugar-phosphate isomerase [bacterium]